MAGVMGIRKFAREQQPGKITERVYPPSPALVQLNDLSMSGFDPVMDLPRVIEMAREVEQPRVAPVAAAPSASPVAAVARQPREVVVPVRAEKSLEDIAREKWEDYNRSGLAADFVRADEALMRARQPAKDGGKTAQGRKRETVQSIGKEPEQVDGEGWQKALAYLRQYPMRPGEAQMQAYNPSLRDIVGSAIAGDDPRSYAGAIRGRLADALVGSTGLEGSGTIGFGALDAIPRVGAALQIGDVGKAMADKDYATAAVMSALPAAIAGRRQIADASRRALEIAREYAPQAGATAAVGATMMPQEAEASKAKAIAQAIASARAMERARELGYDTSKVWYHSATQPIDQFQPHSPFMGRSGVAGIHVTDNPQMANRYLERFGNYNYRNEPFQKNVIPVFVKTENTLERDAPFPGYTRMGQPIPENYRSPLLDQGYDSMLRNEAISGRGNVRHVDPGTRGAIEGKELILTDPSQVRSIYDEYAEGGEVEGYDKGGMIKRAMQLAREYTDPKTTKIEDWKWRPLSDVQKDLNLTEIPPHVQKFGDYMREVSEKAAKEGLSADDLIRAFTTTRASIQRQAVEPDKVRAAGLPVTGDEKIRPEGAWAEWLMTPMGRKFVGEAARGDISNDTVAQAIRIMAPFGRHETDIPEAMRWAAQNLPGREKAASDLVARGAQMASDPSEWREFTRDVRGIGPSKSGFIASLIGRGDLPTLDAREIILHTGEPSKLASKYLPRGKGLGGQEAVDRLAARQTEMALETPEQYKPFYQHLTHHTVWDKVGNDVTTHDDLMRAMRSGFDDGGAVEEKPGLVDRALSFLSQFNPIGSAEAAPVKSIVKAGSRAAKTPTAQTFSGPDLIVKDPNAATTILSKRDPAGAVDFGQAINRAEYTFMPKGDLQPWKEFDPVQAVRERGVITGLLGDRSAAGSIVQDINGVRLTEPVNRMGGGEFQRSLEGPEVWASRPAAVKNMYTRINKQMKQLGAPQDSPVFATHVLMGLPGIDSTQAMAKSILRQIEPTRGNIDPKVAAVFDETIRKKYPNWPGILNPEEAENFLATKEVGKRTSKILQQLDTAKAQAGGLPNLGTARFAMMEPRLVSADQGMTGFAVSRLDPRAIINVAAHDTYPTGMLGPSQSAADYMGGTRYQIPLSVMFPDWWKTVKPTYVEKKTGLTKATSPTMIQQSVLTQVPVQRATQEWLDNLMKYIEENPKKWGYRLGGTVPKKKIKKSANIKEPA